MYTDSMKRAFRSITAPKNFGVQIVDNDNFLSVKIDAKSLVKLDHDAKIEAVQYIFKVKKALEQNGAIVLLTREAIKDAK
jgi:hypothetical protein